MLDVGRRPARLAVIANTGDDIEIYGAPRLARPRPRLLLAGRPDRRARLGPARRHVRGDGRAARARPRRLVQPRRPRPRVVPGARADARRGGLAPTAALARLNEAIGVRARVLPMSDDPVRTWIRTTAGWHAFQEFMIRRRAAGIVEGLEFRGAEQARPSAEVLAAIAGARAIVIGPSNPLVSIAPILAVPGMREALLAAPAPVVAVSPIVGGEVLKGPTAAFMAFAALRVQRRRRGRLLRRAARRDRRRRERRPPAGAADRHAHGRRRAPARAWPSRCSTSRRRSPG